MKSIILYIWNKVFITYFYMKDMVMRCLDKIYCLCHKYPNVLSIEDTLQLILKENLSISRFGDGEIKLIAGKDLAFQKYSKELKEKLIEVISSSIKGHLVCLAVIDDLSIYTKESEKHWEKHFSYYRKYWYKYLIAKKIYGNTQISRCYLDLKDKSKSKIYFFKIREIWDKRDIIIVEGEQSRLGVGNDLFSNTKSIKRILAPNIDAFDFYDDIMKEVTKFNPKEYIILLALGPTATILAYDLSKIGYRALDIGHIDIEYEWFKNGAIKKIPVKNKFVNEAGGGKNVGYCFNKQYLKEIICRF